MFCQKCGAELKEGQSFCTKCGSPVQPAGATGSSGEPKTSAAPNPSAVPKKKHTAIIAAVIALVCVAALVCVLLFIFNRGSNNTPEGLAEKYMKALAGGDVDAVEELHYPGLEEMGDDAYDFVEDLKDKVEEGGKITYKIHEYDKLSKRELEAVRDYVETNHDFEADMIDEAGVIDCSFTLRGSDSRDSETLYLVVLKISDKWYLFFLEDTRPNFGV